MTDVPERYFKGVGVYGYVPGRIVVKDDFFKDFPEEAEALIHDVNQYWKDNVEKYFSKSLSYPIHVEQRQMRNACRIQTLKKGGTSNGALIVDMAPMYDKGFNYAEVIVNGRKPAEHSRYIPDLGVSVDVDPDMMISYESALAGNFGKTTRGTDNMAWKIWVKVFNRYVRTRMVLFTKQCIKKGMIRRTT